MTCTSSSIKHIPSNRIRVRTFQQYQQCSDIVNFLQALISFLKRVNSNKGIRTPKIFQFKARFTVQPCLKAKTSVGHNSRLLKVLPCKTWKLSLSIKVAEDWLRFKHFYVKHVTLRLILWLHWRKCPFSGPQILMQLLSHPKIFILAPGELWATSRKQPQASSLLNCSCHALLVFLLAILSDWF